MDQIMTGLYAAAVVALTELIRRVNAKDYKGAGVIVLASLIGLGAGYLGLGHLNLLTGFVAGLGASGVHQIASASGGK